MVTLLYVDVSHHDRARRGAPLDWPSIRAVTSPVMCARATYGDPNGFSPDTFFFAEFQQGARAAGFTLRGGYHNLVRGDAASMRRQVDWLRRELDAQGCDWAMLDIERYKELVERDLWPRWDDVLRFRDAWRAVESRPLTYYLPQWLYNGYYAGADLRQLPGPLVQSHYAGGDGAVAQIYANAGGDSGTGWDDAYGGRLPEIWQFTSDANVPGASDKTDVNAFRGSIEQLAALLTGDDVADTELATWAAWRQHTIIHNLPYVPSVEEGAPKGLAGERNELHFALKALGAKLDALNEALKGGVTVPAEVGLSPAALGAVEAIVRDVEADALEGGVEQVRADGATSA